MVRILSFTHFTQDQADFTVMVYLCPTGLFDTVFDVDHDKERAQAQVLEPNGFSFDGADAPGVDYALNR